MIDAVGGGDSTRPQHTRFNRYEYKYRLPRGLAAAVRSCVAIHLPQDRYSAAMPDGYYDISSLYLDSSDLRLCRESHAGVKNRFKLRIRAYDDQPESPVYLEVKRRLNRVIMKDRTAASRDCLAMLASGGLVTSDPSARPFHLYRQLISAQPQALIRYRREAFEGTGPARVRVTFDRDLSSRGFHQWRVEVHDGVWRRVLADEVVMEIKYDGRFPAWVHDLVKRFQLQARSVSKYCLGMHTCTPAASGYLSRAEAF